MSARWQGILTGLGLVAVAAALVLFPAALMRSKGHHGAPTASAAVAAPGTAALVRSVIAFSFRCQSVGLTITQCVSRADTILEGTR